MGVGPAHGEINLFLPKLLYVTAAIETLRKHTRVPSACVDTYHTNPAQCSHPQKGAKRSTYSSKAHHWRSAIGGSCSSGGGTHLGWDVVQAGISAWAGEGAIHLVVAHHGKGCCIGAGEGDGCAQGGGCEEVNEEGISGERV